MKRLIQLISLVAIFASIAWAGEQKMTRVYNRLTDTWLTHPELTIRQIQENRASALDSLDYYQTSIPSLAPIQYSPYHLDTVVIVAVCVVPWDVIRYTACGMTQLLADTGSSPDPWGGILVRCANRTDDPQHELDGFKNVQRGHIIRMTGIINEFPKPNYPISSTQFEPIPGILIEIIGSQEVPPPIRKEVTDFYLVGGSSPNVNFSDGEPYEGLVVELTNLTVDSYVNYGRGTFNMVDINGKPISMYDWSKWFTLQLEATDCYHRDPNSTYERPPIGAIVDTIRGCITTSSGAENPRGYRIAPIFEGDIIYGSVVLPNLSSHRRNPISVTSVDLPQVSVRVTVGSSEIDTVVLYYRVNFGPYNSLGMIYDPVDTLYKAQLPTQSVGTLVNYFMKVSDIMGYSRMYVSAHPQMSSDTSKGTFFYRVLSGEPTIYDVQYTPFLNGYSSLYADTLILRGIVTADTNHLMKSGLTTFGTYTWYLQNGNGPWSGIWVQAPESLMHGIVNGDSIAVRGRVGEGTAVTSIVTNLYGVDSVAKLTSGNPVPEPVNKPTGDFGPTTDNGSPTAEPYEGVLVRLTNVTVSDLYPYWADPTEYAVDDGTGPVRVRRDGLNSYSNLSGDTLPGRVVFTLGDHIDTLIGVMYNSARSWKIVPRTNADYVTGRRYNVSNRWNMVSVPRIVPDFTKTIVYSSPPAVSQAYTYENGYEAKAVLQNGVGYWLKFSGNNTIRYNGVQILEDTIDVVRGWNMIGSITDSVETSTIEKIPSNMVTSQYYGYMNGYYSSTVIVGGLGYWVKTDSTGKLILKQSTSLFREPSKQDIISLMNSITISDRNQNTQTLYFGPNKDNKIRLDSYVMPPLPPTGGFDARYTSNMMLEQYPVQLSAAQEYPIKLTSASYPLIINSTIIEKDPNKSYSISADGKTYQLLPGGSVIIKSAKNDVITLSVRNSDLPREFALNQNYPNPFNPSTQFTIAVPQLAKVEVVVYDILGRKVKTLLNEEKSVGYHLVEWNGTSESNYPVSTGVYFVRMNSEKFNAIRKIMMMK